MKKIKKVLAMIMAMAMIMGLGLTANAANAKSTITIKNLAGTGTNTVEYYKILEPDVKAESGYKFVEGVNVDGFATAKAFIEAGVEAKKTALNSEKTVLGTKLTDGTVEGTTWTANVEAGLYAAFATNTSDKDEPVVTYTNPMILSVQYDKAAENGEGYDYNVAATQDKNAVVAKFTRIPVEKTGQDADGDDVVEIGQKATYTIKTFMPSEVESFKLKDALTGATYDKETVKVTIGRKPVELADGMVTFDDKKNTMTIDLTSKLEGNEGKAVVVTYDVTITGTEVNNTVEYGDGKHEANSNVTFYTGSIKLTKYADNKKTPMAGAEFVVFKNTKEGVRYAVVVNGNIQSWTAVKKDATRLTTNADGVIQVNGLNLGTYSFEEVEAPDGFTINTDKPAVEVKRENTTAEAEFKPASTEMYDTNIIGLPSTGGIGTTLFTIGGIVIMVAAAALYFANRKKTEK